MTPPLAPADRRFAGLVKLGIFLAIVVVGNVLARGMVDGLELTIRPSTEPTLHRIIMVSMAAYVLLMAIPFVPGVEVGLALMMILGPKIVPLVYGCTIVSLTLAFLIGRMVPEASIVQFLRELHLFRLASFLAEFQGLSAHQRLAGLSAKTPKRWLPWLARHRYLTLMVAINLPGNLVLGGGGGLAVMAGMSRLFSTPRYLLSILVAVSPVPVLLLLFGDAIANWPI